VTVRARNVNVLVERGVADPCTMLTGLPRAGTTLACELLNRLPDVRALDEPMDPNELLRAATRDDGRSLDAECVRAGVERFAAEQRRSILDRGVALTLHVNGRVLGARLSEARDGDGLRTAMARRSETPVAPPASRDFTLVIKHPVAFTALLPVLRERFPVVAIVRNPLSVLASWESVPFPHREGRLGLRPIVAPEVAGRLEAIEDRLERQVVLLNWFFECYAAALPRERVIRYEDVVASGGAALAPIAPGAGGLRVALESRNAASVYDRAHMREVGRRLLAQDGAYRLFYTPEEVAAAMTEAGVG
jgi:hypothetical protein